VGESQRKKRVHEDVLRRCPICIYCAANPATTVEHMPPRIMFREKRRPKGLEFGACGDCNHGSSYADLVAAIVGRVFPDPATPEEEFEFRRLLQALDNNIPGMLEEMHLSEQAQAADLRKLPTGFDGGLLRVGGPLVTRYMRAFSLKLVAALHHEVTKEIVPAAGCVTARWLSNFERVTGAFPDTVFDHLLPPQTLAQGSFEVSDQFQYSWRTTEGGTAGVYFASFRFAFAIVGAAARDCSMFRRHEGVPTFSPMEVGRLLRDL
jgi:hypothetical protein